MQQLIDQNNFDFWTNNEEFNFYFDNEPDWVKPNQSNFEGMMERQIAEVQSPKRQNKREQKQEFKESSSDDEMTPDSKDLNRIRAKRNRRRKKTFYEHLEQRNKLLEHENRKLHNQIQEMKLEISKLIINPNSDEKQYFKKYSSSKIETCSDSDESILSKTEMHDTSQQKETERQMKILKCCFSTIISNLLSRKQLWMISELDSNIKEDPRCYKRFMKMAKFQKHDFLEENKLSETDEMLANTNPSKRQLHIYKNFFRPEFQSVKELIQCAQDSFFEACFKMDSLMEYNLESSIFTQDEVTKAVNCIKQNNYEATISLEKVFGLKTEAKSYEFGYKRQCVRALENSKFARKMFKYKYETD